MSVARIHPTIKDLQKMGFPITPGYEYFPKSWVSKKAPSLKEIHKRLSKIKISFAEIIAQIRQEE